MHTSPPEKKLPVSFRQLHYDHPPEYPHFSRVSSSIIFTIHTPPTLFFLHHTVVLRTTFHRPRTIRRCFFFGFYMLSDFSVCFFGFSLSLVSIHTRDTDMGFLSVRPSICPYIAVLSLNHYMYCRTFYTVWYCHDSSFFWPQTLWALNTKRVGKICVFQPISPDVSETVRVISYSFRDIGR